MKHMVTNSKPVRINKELMIEAERIAEKEDRSIPRQINRLVRIGLKCASGERK
jgi:hypothetical protein